MISSSFKKDLSKEEILSTYLDELYAKKYNTSNFSIQRITDLDLQHKGVDLILDNKKEKFNVDEKAQLDYLNHSLPTFAFEISYLKNNEWRKGWLFDENKITDIYFLITNIYTKTPNNLSSGLSKIKITGIYREKLIKLLSKKGLTESVLYKLEKEIRKSEAHGKIELEQLDSKTEGLIYYSKTNKNEQPINLVLKLDFLIKNKTGKVAFKL